MAVLLCGQVREERLCVGSERAIESAYSAGQAFDFSPDQQLRPLKAA